MKRKAALHNLGCKVNAYETEAMQQLLEENGYEIVPFEEVADVYIINTCTVTNIADRKSRQMLHRAKKQNPEALVVAAGCYVQARGEEVAQDEAVDLILGNNQKSELVRRLEECFADREENPSGQIPSEEIREENRSSDQKKDGEKKKILEDLTGQAAYEELGIVRTAEHTRAFLKIQDGCNQFCSYCIIPFARGRIRSRRPEDVIREVTCLAEAGYGEIVLTGIHLSSYGLDFPEGKKTPEEPFGHGLLDLILEIAKIPGIHRIRLGSLEPRIITEDFVRQLSACPKVCPHFHLSLQSGSTGVLKRMNRHYTAEEYLAKCELLRKYYAHPAITTDVIVGFPGETPEEFQETFEFVQKVHFYEMHVFPYSRRQGTVADRMPDQIPENIKKERSHKLLALSEQMSEAYRQSLIGQEADLLLEEPDSDGDMAGYTREYVRVSLPGTGARAGEEVHGKIACGNGKYILE
jgi:threonylcarbamoyladenosine tRNA methylthiotransferase MtaB